MRKIHDSNGVTLIYIAAALCAIVGFFRPVLHTHPTATMKAAPAATVAVLGNPAAPQLTRPAAHSVDQSSSRIESPNIKHVKHDVKIQYGSAPAGMLEGSRVNALPVAATSSALIPSTVKTLYRVQSPDISDIGGSVDIRYNSTTTASDEKSPEEPK